eukprot:SAG31_NODE_5790_length_2327_cov_1.929982_5_plen_30_part_00
MVVLRRREQAADNDDDVDDVKVANPIDKE